MLSIRILGRQAARLLRHLYEPREAGSRAMQKEAQSQAALSHGRVVMSEDLDRLSHGEPRISEEPQQADSQQAESMSRTSADCFSAPDLAAEHPEVARALESPLFETAALARSDYERAFAERFDQSRPLVIGQTEYVRQHKERFFELFDTCGVLLAGRTAPRVLEFGTSELSACYGDLFPHWELHLSDRPTEPDYIGFSESTARRVSGCAEYFPLDLEGGAAAIQASALRPGSYDLIVLTEVLEHLVVNPVELLAALLALLRPDGYLYLTTPNFFRRANLLKLAALEHPQAVYPRAGENWDRHHHHREFGARELLRFASEAGGHVHAFQFSGCWDSEPDLKPHERANLVLILSPSRPVSDDRLQPDSGMP